MVQGRFSARLRSSRVSLTNRQVLPVCGGSWRKPPAWLVDRIENNLSGSNFQPMGDVVDILVAGAQPRAFGIAAVARYLAFRAATEQPPCSADTSSYCQARQRLPVELVSRLVHDTGKDLHAQASRILAQSRSASQDRGWFDGIDVRHAQQRQRVWQTRQPERGRRLSLAAPARWCFVWPQVSCWRRPWASIAARGLAN